MNEADKKALEELAEWLGETSIAWYVESAALIRRTLQEIERLEKEEPKPRNYESGRNY